MRLDVKRHGSFEAARVAALKAIEQSSSTALAGILRPGRTEVWQAKLEGARGWKSGGSPTPWLEEESAIRGLSIDSMAALVAAKHEDTQRRLRRIEMARLTGSVAIEAAQTPRDVHLIKTRTLEELARLAV